MQETLLFIYLSFLLLCNPQKYTQLNVIRFSETSSQ